MKLNDVEEILSRSSKDDWIVDDVSGSFTYKYDLNLHIERNDFDNYRPFHEEWATKHADPSATAVEYTVKYGTSFVEHHTLVSVDGFRAILPMPKGINDLSVKASKVNFAKIVDVGDSVDKYINLSGLHVED